MVSKILSPQQKSPITSPVVPKDIQKAYDSENDHSSSPSTDKSAGADDIIAPKSKKKSKLQQLYLPKENKHLIQ